MKKKYQANIGGKYHSQRQGAVEFLTKLFKASQMNHIQTVCLMEMKNRHFL